MAGAHDKVTKRNHRGLTPQQDAFAVAISEGATQAEAYRKAYPASRNWEDKSVWSKASQLAKHAIVRTRIAEMKQAIQARVVEKAAGEQVYTARVAMNEALQAFEMAIETRQPGAMVAAVQLRAKLNGLITDKKEVSVTQMGGMTPSEKDYMLQQAMAEIERRRLQINHGDITDIEPKDG